MVAHHCSCPSSLALSLSPSLPLRPNPLPCCLGKVLGLQAAARDGKAPSLFSCMPFPVSVLTTRFALSFPGPWPVCVLAYVPSPSELPASLLGSCLAHPGCSGTRDPGRKPGVQTGGHGSSWGARSYWAGFSFRGLITSSSVSGRRVIPGARCSQACGYPVHQGYCCLARSLLAAHRPAAAPPTLALCSSL